MASLTLIMGLIVSAFLCVCAGIAAYFAVRGV
jgi:hypothetical protein